MTDSDDPTDLDLIRSYVDAADTDVAEAVERVADRIHELEAEAAGDAYNWYERYQDARARIADLRARIAELEE